MSLDIEALYVQEYARLCVYIRKRLPSHDADEAADVASEVFLRAWGKRHQYQPRAGAKPSSWLYRIAVNLLTDYYRRRGVVAFVRLDDIRPYFEDVGTSDHIDRIDVVQALSGYQTGNPRYSPHKQISVIRARFFGDADSDADVGRRLGLSTVSVKKLRVRALTNLRKLLEVA